MYIWCISMCMFVCVRALCALCRLHKFICNWLLWSNLIWNVISHLIHIHIHILFYCLLQLQQEKHFKCHKNHNNTGICRLSKVVKLSFCKKKKKNIMFHIALHRSVMATQTNGHHKSYCLHKIEETTKFEYLCFDIIILKSLENAIPNVLGKQFKNLNKWFSFEWNCEHWIPMSEQSVK